MFLGVVVLVYEFFFELVAIVVGFCLKMGNSLVLRSCGVLSYFMVVICEILWEGLLDVDLLVDSVSYIFSEILFNV